MLRLVVAAVAFSPMLIAQSFDLAQPTARSYFPLSEQLAAQIEKKFSLPAKSIPRGLYYTDSAEAHWRTDVRPSQMTTTRHDFDATYLLQDSFNQFLYGKHQWRRKLSHRVPRDDIGRAIRDSAGKPSVIALDEFKVTVGWINHEAEDGVVREQLWLWRPTNERWKLLERTKGETALKNTWTMGIPDYFLPVGDGVVAFAEDWQLIRTFANQKRLHSFDYLPMVAPKPLQGKRVREVKFQLATRLLSGRDRIRRPFPLLFHHPEKQKVIFAGWTSLNPRLLSPGREGAAPELSKAEPVSLFLLDLDNNVVQELASGLTWPFSLNQNGLLSVPVFSEQTIEFRALDWNAPFLASEKVPVSRNVSREYLPRFEATGFYYLRNKAGMPATKYDLNSKGDPVERVADPQEKFTRVPQEALYQLEQLDYPPDLLHAVLSGERIPRYGTAKVTDDLVKVLTSSTGRTWAILAYEPGDFALDLIGDFLWRMATENLVVPESLSVVSNAFWFPSYYFRQKKDRVYFGAGPGPMEKLDREDILKRIYTATDQKQSLAFFEDFPSGPGRYHSEERLKDSEKLFESFHSTFDKCAEKGTCRLIMSTPKAVLIRLQEKKPELLRNAQIITIPEIGDKDRITLGRVLGREFASRYRVTIADKVLDELVFLADERRAQKIKDKESPLKVPGYYQLLFEEFFSYAQSQFLRFNTDASREIPITMVEQFGKYKSGVHAYWHLTEREKRLEGQDEPLRILEWTKPGQAPKEALKPSHYRAWQENPDRVISQLGIPHAVVNIGSTFQPDETGLEKGAVDLLLPEASPVRILNEEAVKIGIHSKGFFYLIAASSEEKMILGSFNISRTNVTNDKAVPGEAIPLKSDLDSDGYGKVWTLEFAGDRATIVEEGKVKHSFGIPPLPKKDDNRKEAK